MLFTKKKPSVVYDHGRLFIAMKEKLYYHVKDNRNISGCVLSGRICFFDRGLILKKV